MILEYLGPISVVIYGMGIAAGILLLFSLWNLAKEIFRRHPAKSKQVYSLEAEYVAAKEEESLESEDVKMWTPRQHNRPSDDTIYNEIVQGEIKQ